MHVEWLYVVSLMVLVAALIREVVKSERRAIVNEAENVKLRARVDSLEHSFASCAQQLARQGAKIKSVQAAIHDMEQHPESIVTNLCRLGVYMERFFVTNEYFDLHN